MPLRAQIRLGRIAGIQIGLHYSWFIIAALITFSLVGHFNQVSPDWRTPIIWSAALITSLLFFAALLLHELAHSVVAKSKGLRVRAITLFALGGVSQIESESPDAKSEFWIAFVGPLTSLVIGFAFLGLARLTGWTAGREAATPVQAVVVWLGYINIALAAFNMIPGYPLDGGRVLRSIIWWITGNQVRSTRAASRVGMGVAILFILFGLYRFFLSADIGSLWIALIGWFLLDAARSSATQLVLTSELHDRHVSDLMEHDCPTVGGFISIKEFVDHYLLHTGKRCFVVLQNDRVAGLVTPGDLKKVPADEWPQTSLQSVMRPLDRMRTVSPDTPALQALEMMAREDINQIPVVSDGHLEGIFSRAHVLRFLQLQSELHRH